MYLIPDAGPLAEGRVQGGKIMKNRKTLLRCIISILIAVAMLPAAALASYAESGETTVNGIRYSYDTNKGTAAVMPEQSVSGDIIIPPSINVGGTDCTVTYIMYQAFLSCVDLHSVTIPNSVTIIDDSAFDDCTCLSEINVDSNNSSYSSSDGVLFSKDKDVLIKYPQGKEGTSYVIPGSVTQIYDKAFTSCDNLEAVTIPSSVTSIGNSAFEYCAKLKTVTIPSSVTSIGEFAYDYCLRLENVVIESPNISIGGWAFCDCEDLKAIYFTGTKDEWSAVQKGSYWSLNSNLGNDPAAKQVTFKVVNGKWNDGSTGDKVITVIGNNADKLIESVIPAVGDEPNENYAAGSWENDPLAATLAGDTTFTYKYEEYEEPKYTVTWEDEKGNPLEIDEDVPYGEVPSFDGDEPTKEAGQLYSYVFAGWLSYVDDEVYDPDNLPAVTGDVTYTAVFDSIENRFTVTWKDENGQVLEIDEDVSFGEAPSFDGDEPTKQKDDTYTYTFTGWSDGTNTYGKNDGLPEVTGDATYTAVYSQRRYKGSVKLIAVVEDDRIKSQNVVIKIYDSATEGTNYTNYGAINVSGTGDFYTVITHIPEGDYTYSVEQADTDIDVSPKTGTFSITGEETTEVEFNLVIPVKSYRVTFVNDDGEITILQSTFVDEGEIPVYSGNTPTKQGDTQYSYEFAGWGDGDNAYEVGVSLPEVTGEVTYTALFCSDLIEYTITWKQDDGTVIDMTSVEYGVTPTHADPTKDADEQYTYTFAGWTPEIVSVEGEKTYTATYTPTPRSYTITWKQDDGTVIDTTSVEYGQMPTHADPTKDADEQYTYTFAGWTPEIVSVEGEKTYTATYSETVNKYTVEFVNEDGTVLQSESVPYGKTPEYKGETPEKAEDDKNTYDFAGWNKDITAVNGDAEYKATFTAVPKAVPHETGDGSLALLITGISSLICLGAVLAYGRKREKDN